MKALETKISTEKINRRTFLIRTPSSTVFIYKKQFANNAYSDLDKKIVDDFINFKLELGVGEKITKKDITTYLNDGLIEFKNITEWESHLTVEGMGTATIRMEQPYDWMYVGPTEIDEFIQKFNYTYDQVNSVFINKHLLQPFDSVFIFANNNPVFCGVIDTVEKTDNQGFYTTTINCKDNKHWLDISIFTTRGAAQPIGAIEDPLNSDGTWKKGITTDGFTMVEGEQKFPSKHYKSMFGVFAAGLTSELKNIFARLDPGNIISITMMGIPYDRNLYLQNTESLANHDLLDEGFQAISKLNESLGNFIPGIIKYVGNDLEKENDYLIKTKEKIKKRKINNYFLVSDEYSLSEHIKAYLLELSPDFELYQVNFNSALSVCEGAADIVDFEYFCDENGNIIFRPPHFNDTPSILSTENVKNPLAFIDKAYSEYLYSGDENYYQQKKKINTQLRDTYNTDFNTYIIPDSVIESLDIYQQRPEFTHLYVNGAHEWLSELGNADHMLWAGFVDYDLWASYGHIFKSISKPFLSDELHCYLYGLAKIGKQEFLTHSANITIIGMHVKVGSVVYIESKKMLFYVTKVTHNYKHGEKYNLTLSLKYGRLANEIIPHPFAVLSMFSSANDGGK